ncbi:Uncharacterised protein [Raoultella planticola]|uniref:Uncharacterized protein n=1 Tax=Raoultella planticola TaxID=575 RepID=A0A485D5Y8_RAOPL|nr:Uncharacterised protein [Raoultella planticola]
MKAAVVFDLQQGLSGPILPIRRPMPITPW